MLVHQGAGQPRRLDSTTAAQLAEYVHEASRRDETIEETTSIVLAQGTRSPNV
jgi:hypothetical protein